MQHNCNGVETSTPQPWRCWHTIQFAQALYDCEQWEKEQAQHGIGTVALSFHNGEWVVLVSQDLLVAALPF